MKYIVPTVTGNLIFSPVLPSHKSIFPDPGRSDSFNSPKTSSILAPSKTGV